MTTLRGAIEELLSARMDAGHAWIAVSDVRSILASHSEDDPVHEAINAASEDVEGVESGVRQGSQSQPSAPSALPVELEHVHLMDDLLETALFYRRCADETYEPTESQRVMFDVAIEQANKFILTHRGSLPGITPVRSEPVSDLRAAVEELLAKYLNTPSDMTISIGFLREELTALSTRGEDHELRELREALYRFADALSAGLSTSRVNARAVAAELRRLADTRRQALPVELEHVHTTWRLNPAPSESLLNECPLCLSGQELLGLLLKEHRHGPYTVEWIAAHEAVERKLGGGE